MKLKRFLPLLAKRYSRFEFFFSLNDRHEESWFRKTLELNILRNVARILRVERIDELERRNKVDVGWGDDWFAGFYIRREHTKLKLILETRT